MRWMGTTLACWLAFAVLPGRSLPADGPFLRGDVDESGGIEIIDAIRLLRFLFGDGAGGVRCVDAADADDDGKVTVTDGIVSLTYLFRNGAPPPAPFPRCGPDPTEDAIGCEAYAGCLHHFAFFGVEFDGDGIFFVVDHSPPQSQNGILTRAKNEIVRIVSEFPGGVQFGIAFFSKGLTKFPSSDQPADSTEEMKASAASWVQAIAGGTGTCPHLGFASALDFAANSTARRKLVIYVGDGGGTCAGNDEVTNLRMMVKAATEQNAGLARIHTLGAFPCEICEGFLQQLAEQNGGAYTRVEG